MLLTRRWVTIHHGLGFNPAPETGGLNKSGLHWDHFEGHEERRRNLRGQEAVLQERKILKKLIKSSA
jgi:hypothetical protein